MLYRVIARFSPGRVELRGHVNQGAYEVKGLFPEQLEGCPPSAIILFGLPAPGDFTGLTFHLPWYDILLPGVVEGEYWL